MVDGYNQIHIAAETLDSAFTRTAGYQAFSLSPVAGVTAAPFLSKAFNTTASASSSMGMTAGPTLMATMMPGQSFHYAATANSSFSADKKADLKGLPSNTHNALGGVQAVQADFKSKFDGVKAELGAQIVKAADQLHIGAGSALQSLMPQPVSTSMVSVVASLASSAAGFGSVSDTATILSEVMNQSKNLSPSEQAKLWDKVQTNISSESRKSAGTSPVPFSFEKAAKGLAVSDALKNVAEAGMLKKLATQSAEQQPEFKALEKTRQGLAQSVDNKDYVAAHYGDTLTAPKVEGAEKSVLKELTGGNEREADLLNMGVKVEHVKELAGTIDPDKFLSDINLTQASLSGIEKMTQIKPPHIAGLDLAEIARLLPGSEKAPRLEKDFKPAAAGLPKPDMPLNAPA